MPPLFGFPVGEPSLSPPRQVATRHLVGASRKWRLDTWKLHMMTKSRKTPDHAKPKAEEPADQPVSDSEVQPDEVEKADDKPILPSGIVGDDDSVEDADQPDKVRVEAGEPPEDGSPHTAVAVDNSSAVSPHGVVVESVEPQYVPGPDVPVGPAVNFSDAVAYAEPPVKDVVRREHEEVADSPHGDLAGSQGYVIHDGAPHDSHNDPEVGDNDVARLRAKQLDEMAVAASSRNDVDLRNSDDVDVNPAAEQPYNATEENKKIY